MRHFLQTLLILCLLPWQVSAQSFFDRANWDFGRIQETEGVVSHVFCFINRSDKPLRITGTLPSCNCILAQIPDGTVEPGQKTDIVVFFSPSGAAGPTHRTIEILGPKGISLGTLSTDADVIPADRSIEERYPVVLSPCLYANMDTVPFGYMAPGQKTSKVIYLANSSDGWMYLETALSGSGKLQVQCPEAIAPGKEVAVMLTYTMPADENYVSRYDTLSVGVEGSAIKGRIRTSAICLTKGKDGAAAPRMRVFPNTGVLKAGLLRRARSGTVEISNDGASDLLIHGVEMPKGMEFSLVPGSRVAPGRTVTAELRLPDGRTGQVAVRIFTNDPIRPYKDIIFKTQ